MDAAGQCVGSRPLLWLLLCPGSLLQAHDECDPRRWREAETKNYWPDQNCFQDASAERSAHQPRKNERWPEKQRVALNRLQSPGKTSARPGPLKGRHVWSHYVRWRSGLNQARHQPQPGPVPHRCLAKLIQIGERDLRTCISLRHCTVSAACGMNMNSALRPAAALPEPFQSLEWITSMAADFATRDCCAPANHPPRLVPNCRWHRIPFPSAVGFARLLESDRQCSRRFPLHPAE